MNINRDMPKKNKNNWELSGEVIALKTRVNVASNQKNGEAKKKQKWVVVNINDDDTK